MKTNKVKVIKIWPFGYLTFKWSYCPRMATIVSNIYSTIPYSFGASAPMSLQLEWQIYYE